MPNTKRQADPDRATRRQKVLTTATVRAAEHLAMPNAAVAEMLGVSVPTVSRMKTGAYLLADGSKPFELAQLFLRLFRSLDAIVGSDDAASQSWMQTENRALNGRPIDLVQTVTGLVSSVTYLDSRRAIV
ncbi:MbcA/ParS/Xre antitoxin family protein [Azospirillum sp. A1-3]|jgi:uncharacterized protein (DUF2384 family)|uniref:MbcA/ParS/Xre antitoxin family protein n=1 Tax=Azospirillum sp. A1-3 TaxID=185874 RepID=UPI002077598F|nr:MbcA/ParS/Xre antitoxin family protein [Azospirillum sp. A1-3]MCM8735276.1 MbcA/ParS/Xre antitoxin family protein [Azospirillum sp. A1-3]